MGVIRSYPKIYNIGHSAIRDLWKDEVVVQEKVDGSQFSFGKNNGVLFCRSKGKEINFLDPEKMFLSAINYVQSIEDKLTDGYSYRCEYLQKPKHNTLAYDRTPKNHLVLFDIDEISSEQKFTSREKLEEEASKLDIDVIPHFFHGVVSDITQFNELLNQISFLGKERMEGIVIKNYSRFGIDGKPLFGKYVRDDFREQNRIAFRVSSPTPNLVIENIINTFKNEVRWKKAIQRLRDDGQLENSMTDIPKLLKEIPEDIFSECKEEIDKALREFAYPKIKRGVIRGFPEFYKEYLLKKSFE